MYMDDVVFKRRVNRAVAKSDSGALKMVVNLGFLVLSFFLFYNIFRSIQITGAKLEILNRAEKEVDSLRVENIRLILEKDTVQSPDYIETEARNRLNYSKDGEILFIIPDSVLELAKEELEVIISGEKGEVEEKEIWKQWYDFFLFGV